MFPTSKVLQPVDSRYIFLGESPRPLDITVPKSKASFLLLYICGSEEQSASGDGSVTQQPVAYLHCVPHWFGWVPWGPKEVCGSPYLKWTSQSSGRENINMWNFSTTILKIYVVKWQNKLSWQWETVGIPRKEGACWLGGCEVSWENNSWASP